MAETKTHSSRLASYRNAGKGTTDLPCKREELSVALRKQARDEQLFERRAMSPEAGEEIQLEEKISEPDEIVRDLKSNNLTVKTAAARLVRCMLSREQDPPVSVMVEAGVIKPLVEALERDECHDLQFEAACAINIIASETHDHTLAVIDGGAIPRLVTLLGQGGVVGEQSTWALGNIASDGAGPRDAVLQHGALLRLLPLLAPATPPSQLRSAVWTYSNLCINKAPMVKVSPALPYIAELLDISDQDVLADACRALSYLSYGSNDRIEAVQATPHLLPRLVRLLEHRASAVRAPALRALGNMLTGSDHQTDRCLDAGCLDRILVLLRCGKSSLMREAAWAASNILAGTTEQIQRAIDKGLLSKLLHVLKFEDVNCQMEATWAITNLCLGGSRPQLDALLAAGILQPYCALLAAPDHRAVVLDGLAHLLQAAVKFGQVEPLCLKLAEIGALDQIKALQQHENGKVNKKVLHILYKYFTKQEDATAQPAKTEEAYLLGTSQQNQNINL